MKKENLLKMVLSGMFLALAYVLPFLTVQDPSLGQVFCPMHIPVLLCGFICGWHWGGMVGFIAPLFRSVTLGMPPMFPGAICMAFELAAYGVVSGLMHKLLPKKRLFIYPSLIVAMIAGRIIWGIAMLACMGIKGGSFAFISAITESVVTAIPGIAIQLVLVPVLVMFTDSQKILKLKG